MLLGYGLLRDDVSVYVPPLTPTGFSPWERAHAMKRTESTRITIATQALEDALARLSELPSSPRSRQLRTRATTYLHAVTSWAVRAPTETQRAEMIRCALDLEMEVIALSRTDPIGRA